MSLFRRWLAWWRRRNVARREAGVDVAMPVLPSVAVPGDLAESVAVPVDVADPECIRDPSAKAGVARDAPTTRRRMPGAAGSAPGPCAIRLALQGGGSHGAFTWGVLDRLLAQPGLRVDAVSGASAGALNGAVLATGWARGGASGARDALAAFWSDVARAAAPFALLSREPFAPAAFGFDALPGHDWNGHLLRMFSPYDYNPLNLNPLRDLVERHVDVAALREGPVALHVTATAVRSGRARVFAGDALGIDALLASACLPFLFQAVEIDGEPYWDGGYSGNPSLYPLIDPGLDSDLLVVRINPAQRLRTPRRSSDILDRINEITFNASLLGELRAIALVTRMLDDGVLVAGHFRGLRLHMIADDLDLATLPASSRVWADAAFVTRLQAMGHAAAERFLAAHGGDLGVRSSLDIAAELDVEVPVGDRAGLTLPAS